MSQNKHEFDGKLLQRVVFVGLFLALFSIFTPTGLAHQQNTCTSWGTTEQCTTTDVEKTRIEYKYKYVGYTQDPHLEFYSSNPSSYSLLDSDGNPVKVDSMPGLCFVYGTQSYGNCPNVRYGSYSNYYYKYENRPETKQYWVNSGYWETFWNDTSHWETFWNDTSHWALVWKDTSHWEEKWVDTSHFELKWIDTSHWENRWVDTSHFELKWIDTSHWENRWVDTSHYEWRDTSHWEQRTGYYWSSETRCYWYWWYGWRQSCYSVPVLRSYSYSVWVSSGYNQWVNSGYWTSVWVVSGYPKLEWVTSGYSERVWVVSGYPKLEWVTSGYLDRKWVESGYPWIEWVVEGHSDKKWVVEGHSDKKWIDTSHWKKETIDHWDLYRYNGYGAGYQFMSEGENTIYGPGTGYVLTPVTVTYKEPVTSCNRVPVCNAYSTISDAVPSGRLTAGEAKLGKEMTWTLALNDLDSHNQLPAGTADVDVKLVLSGNGVTRTLLDWSSFSSETIYSSVRLPADISEGSYTLTAYFKDFAPQEDSNYDQGSASASVAISKSELPLAFSYSALCIDQPTLVSECKQPVTGALAQPSVYEYVQVDNLDLAGGADAKLEFLVNGQLRSSWAAKGTSGSNFQVDGGLLTIRQSVSLSEGSNALSLRVTDNKNGQALSQQLFTATYQPLILNPSKPDYDWNGLTPFNPAIGASETGPSGDGGNAGSGGGFGDAAAGATTAAAAAGVYIGIRGLASSGAFRRFENGTKSTRANPPINPKSLLSQLFGNIGNATQTTKTAESSKPFISLSAAPSSQTPQQAWRTRVALNATRSARETIEKSNSIIMGMMIPPSLVGLPTGWYSLSHTNEKQKFQRANSAPRLAGSLGFTIPTAPQRNAPYQAAPARQQPPSLMQPLSVTSTAQQPPMPEWFNVKPVSLGYLTDVSFYTAGGQLTDYNHLIDISAELDYTDVREIKSFIEDEKARTVAFLSANRQRVTDAHPQPASGTMSADQTAIANADRYLGELDALRGKTFAKADPEELSLYENDSLFSNVERAIVRDKYWKQLHPSPVRQAGNAVVGAGAEVVNFGNGLKTWADEQEWWNPLKYLAYAGAGGSYLLGGATEGVGSLVVGADDLGAAIAHAATDPSLLVTPEAWGHVGGYFVNGFTGLIETFQRNPLEAIGMLIPALLGSKGAGLSKAGAGARAGTAGAKAGAGLEAGVEAVEAAGKGARGAAAAAEGAVEISSRVRPAGGIFSGVSEWAADLASRITGKPRTLLTEQEIIDAVSKNKNTRVPSTGETLGEAANRVKSTLDRVDKQPDGTLVGVEEKAVEAPLTAEKLRNKLEGVRSTDKGVIEQVEGGAQQFNYLQEATGGSARISKLRIEFDLSKSGTDPAQLPAIKEAAQQYSSQTGIEIVFKNEPKLPAGGLSAAKIGNGGTGAGGIVTSTAAGFVRMVDNIKAGVPLDILGDVVNVGTEVEKFWNDFAAREAKQLGIPNPPVVRFVKNIKEHVPETDIAFTRVGSGFIALSEDILKKPIKLGNTVVTAADIPQIIRHELTHQGVYWSTKETWGPLGDLTQGAKTIIKINREANEKVTELLTSVKDPKNTKLTIDSGIYGGPFGLTNKIIDFGRKLEETGSKIGKSIADETTKLKNEAKKSGTVLPAVIVGLPLLKLLENNQQPVSQNAAKQPSPEPGLVTNLVTKAVNTVTNTAKAATNTATGIVSTVINTVTGAVKNAASGVANFVSGLFGGGVPKPQPAPAPQPTQNYTAVTQNAARQTTTPPVQQPTPSTRANVAPTPAPAPQVSSQPTTYTPAPQPKPQPAPTPAAQPKPSAPAPSPVQTVINTVVNTVNTAVKTVVNTVTPVVNTAVNTVVSAAKAVGNAVEGAVKGALGFLGGLFR